MRSTIINASCRVRSLSTDAAAWQYINLDTLTYQDTSSQYTMGKPASACMPCFGLRTRPAGWERGPQVDCDTLNVISPSQKSVLTRTYRSSHILNNARILLPLVDRAGSEPIGFVLSGVPIFSAFTADGIKIEASTESFDG
jgi:hypothetical protein